MFFIASKVLVFLIRPINWIVLLLLIAWRSNSAKWKTRSIVAALMILLSGSNRALLNLVAGWWELAPTPLESLEPAYDIGILLGGYSNPFGWPDDGRHHFNNSANRFTQTLELYQQGKIKKILLTGGWSRILGPEKMNEAHATRTYLERLGIPAEDILLETQSRNTWENAEFTRALLEKTPEKERCLLITSAWHMRRSIACFKKAGFETDYYCVDYMRNQPRIWWEDLIKFEPEVFQRWEWLIKEWVGILAYKWKGYN